MKGVVGMGGNGGEERWKGGFWWGEGGVEIFLAPKLREWGERHLQKPSPTKKRNYIKGKQGLANPFVAVSYSYFTFREVMNE